MNYKKQLVSGAKWTTLSTVITSVVALLRLSILTRILDKSDFGIVAILTFVVGLTQTFSDLGFSAAIMHEKVLSREKFSGLYWIQLMFFSAIYLLMSSGAFLIADFYAEPQLIVLLPIMLLELPIFGIGRLYETVLQKEFLFRIIAVRNIVSSLLSLVLAMVLALCGYGVYSLVFSTLFNALFLNVWNLWVGQKQVRLKWVLPFRQVWPMMKIGFFQTGTQIVDYIAGKLDVFLMGKFLGMETLGVYSLSKEILVKVYTVINGIANKLLLPLLAKQQSDLEALRNNYLTSIHLLTFVTFPLLIAIGAFSVPVVSILYGDQFAEAAPIITLLSVSYLFSAVSNPVGALTVALGRTDTSFYYTIARLAMTLPIVVFTSSISLRCVAYGQIVLGFFGFLLVYIMMIKRYLFISLAIYMYSFLKNACVVLAFGAICSVVVNYNPFNVVSDYLNLLIYGTLALLLYLMIIFFLYRNDKVVLQAVYSFGKKMKYKIHFGKVC